MLYNLHFSHAQWTFVIHRDVVKMHLFQEDKSRGIEGIENLEN